jgi:hypothetical protein
MTYWVLPQARGRGVAALALGAVADWAFDAVGFHRLELDHSTQNAASCRVATKAGFAPEGTRRARALPAIACPCSAMSSALPLGATGLTMQALAVGICQFLV